jgi:hypothetical protein
MSSLKDIMDVDVEPLESQAYRRKEAAQQQASRPSLDPSSQSPSPQLDDNRGKPSVNRRRSNRVSKSATQTTTSRSTIPRRRSSAAAEAMDFSGFQLGGSSQGSIAGSPLQTSSRGGMDQVGDVPVKYTPVTGRISRAKKGIPVHTCEDCKPAKVCRYSGWQVTLLSTNSSADFYTSRTSQVSSTPIEFMKPEGSIRNPSLFHPAFISCLKSSTRSIPSLG